MHTGNGGRVTSGIDKRLKTKEMFSIRARQDWCHQVSMMNGEIRSLFVFYGFRQTCRETKEVVFDGFTRFKSSMSENVEWEELLMIYGTWGPTWHLRHLWTFGFVTWPLRPTIRDLRVRMRTGQIGWATNTELRIFKWKIHWNCSSSIFYFCIMVNLKWN